VSKQLPSNKQIANFVKYGTNSAKSSEMKSRRLGFLASNEPCRAYNVDRTPHRPLKMDDVSFMELEFLPWCLRSFICTSAVITQSCRRHVISAFKTSKLVQQPRAPMRNTVNKRSKATLKKDRFSEGLCFQGVVLFLLTDFWWVCVCCLVTVSVCVSLPRWKSYCVCVNAGCTTKKEFCDENKK